MENRRPNSNCTNCTKPIYRRPHQLSKGGNVFCTTKCVSEFFKNEDNCKTCGNAFKKIKSSQLFCSKQCSGVATRNRKPSKRPYKNQSERNLFILNENFNFSSCMVENCDYDRTYDIHRLVEGKDGGKYEIGNMFAICPNHHAEIHRRLTKVKKIDNETLKIMED